MSEVPDIPQVRLKAVVCACSDQSHTSASFAALRKIQHLAFPIEHMHAMMLSNRTQVSQSLGVEFAKLKGHLEHRSRGSAVSEILMPEGTL